MHALKKRNQISYYNYGKRELTNLKKGPGFSSTMFWTYSSRRLSPQNQVSFHPYLPNQPHQKRRIHRREPVVPCSFPSNKRGQDHNESIRFWRAPVALSANISKMVLQVGISSNDRPYHRFAWRNYESSRDPGVFEFSCLLFGNTASPFCAQFILQTHAQEHSVKYPSAAKTVDNLMYVDDICDTVKEAQKLRQQLSKLVGDAGFKLRKWSSNKVFVIEGIPPADQLSSLEITDGLPSTRREHCRALQDPT